MTVSVWLFLTYAVLSILFSTSDAFLRSRGLTKTYSQTALSSKVNRSKTSNRKAKQNKNRKKAARTRATGPMKGPISQDDLRQHVTAEYLHGPNGILHGADTQYTKTSDKHLAFLKELERYPALLLNADYQPMSYLPLSMWNWQESIKAVFSGKVTVVDVYPDVHVRAASIEIPLPSVIALNEYVAQPNTIPAFTKRNVFLRDEYKCQYCNHRFHSRDLSLDHVHPRSMGGQLIWENAVTSCRVCNGRKGSKLVSELKHIGMKLAREPFVPTQYQLHAIASKLLPKQVHPTWVPFLPMELQIGKVEKALESELFVDESGR
eukprot:CAMPEP_0202446588 /NCGR_PEP_ID=MMETSP1360-20130828/5104_1 /ASSEMBLY_ACC=CAM_ASM_000848 /TAXON_ID=515479 /ORGANISM="Licmophora paradoxa, Strain CCMP2313" /LENGTH=319 /DNA_ID=CAMNT_0049063153 /DNA_START=160 /DNA_END=1119 /DNA_ORIENTATION=-